MEVVSNLSSIASLVLAVYVEVVPAVSSTVSLGTGGVHGGGP